MTGSLTCKRSQVRVLLRPAWNLLTSSPPYARTRARQRARTFRLYRIPPEMRTRWLDSDSSSSATSTDFHFWAGEYVQVRGAIRGHRIVNLSCRQSSDRNPTFCSISECLGILHLCGLLKANSDDVGHVFLCRDTHWGMANNSD